ncbi:MAG TPA: LysR substrate-binding domain-containing protein [Streptosporangiaceae bacterium]|nr:LysR substrate-binding domain-containing protein [Streptosporangiaceae bacterium]
MGCNGFVEGPDLPDGLRAVTVSQDELTVVIAPGHPWIQRRSGITAAELADTALVTREAASGTRRFFERHSRIRLS